MLVQEGFFDATDIVTIALVNMSLDGNGDVKPRLFVLETDDRVREALEKRFAGVGPAADTLAREWFERKELQTEEQEDLAANELSRQKKVSASIEEAAYSSWKQDVKIKEDVFTQYLEQQQLELEESRKSPVWRIKNWLWQKGLGGSGPYTRDIWS